VNGASGEDEASSGDILPGLGRASERGWMTGVDDLVCNKPTCANMEESSF
jgi:hypothetical protein